MEEADAVRRLVEMLSAFFTEGRAVEEDVTYSLTKEFLRNMQDVLFTKQIVSYSRFRYLIIDYEDEMLSSPEMYLSYIFYACLQDADVNPNIFERFLSAFSLILRMSIEIRLGASVDFCKLVPITFMVLYENKLRVKFTKNGFRRFVEYINSPKYLKSKCIERNISSFYDHNASIDEIPDDLSEKAQIIMKKQKFQKYCRFLDPEIDHDMSSLAKSVLKITESKLIPILNDIDLNASPANLVGQKTAQMDEEKKNFKISEGDSKSTFLRCPSLCSDSKTDDDAVAQITDNKRFENIIEAVIRHNHSKNSCHAKWKGRIQMEADGILDQMKKNLKSLTEVLDEYEKE